MMNTLKTLIFVVAVLIVASCSTGGTVDIKSPCVSGDGGPCGPRMPVNDHWLNGQSINS